MKKLLRKIKELWTVVIVLLIAVAFLGGFFLGSIGKKETLRNVEYINSKLNAMYKVICPK